MCRTGALSTRGGILRGVVKVETASPVLSRPVRKQRLLIWQCSVCWCSTCACTCSTYSGVGVTSGTYLPTYLQDSQSQAWDETRHARAREMPALEHVVCRRSCAKIELDNWIYHELREYASPATSIPLPKNTAFLVSLQTRIHLEHVG